MSTITLKAVPVALHRALKAKAEAHGRSLNREIMAILDSSLHSTPIDAKEIGARAHAVRESMGVYLTQKDLAAFKNAGRR